MYGTILCGTPRRRLNDTVFALICLFQKHFAIVNHTVNIYFRSYEKHTGVRPLPYSRIQGAAVTPASSFLSAAGCHAVDIRRHLQKTRVLLLFITSWTDC